MSTGNDSSNVLTAGCDEARPITEIDALMRRARKLDSNFSTDEYKNFTDMAQVANRPILSEASPVPQPPNAVPGIIAKGPKGLTEPYRAPPTPGYLNPFTGKREERQDLPDVGVGRSGREAPVGEMPEYRERLKERHKARTASIARGRALGARHAAQGREPDMRLLGHRDAWLAHGYREGYGK